MSAESGLKIRIGYEDVEALRDELGKVSKNLSEVTTKLEKMDGELEDVAESSKKSAKSLGLIAGIKKLELVGLLGGMFNKMMDIGRASPLLASNLAVINWQFEEIGMIVGDAVAPMFELLSDILQDVIDWWYNLDEGLKESIIIGIQVAAMLGIVAAAWIFLHSAAFPIIAVLAGIVIGVAILNEIWKKFGDEIMALINEVISFIVGAFESFLDWIDKLFDDPLGAILDVFAAWYTMIADIFTIGWKIIDDLVTDALKFLVDIFKDVPILGGFVKGLQLAWDNISTIIGGIINIFVSLIDFLTGKTSLSDFVSEIINAIGDIVGALINMIIDPINTALKTLEDAINMIRNIEIFGSYLFRIIPKVDIPRLPRFHEGGYIGGYTGQEVPIVAKAEELMLTAKQDNLVDDALSVALGALGGGGNTSNDNSNTVVNVYMNDNSISGSQMGRSLGGSLVDQLRSKGAYK